MEFQSCLQKQGKLKEMFLPISTLEGKYHTLIKLGEILPPFDPQHERAENRVEGCQSLTYLTTRLEMGKLFFSASSHALISKGIAALLISIYEGEPPEALLKCSPTCLEEIGIEALLSPNRVNGLHSLHLRMQRDALKALS